LSAESPGSAAETAQPLTRNKPDVNPTVMHLIRNEFKTFMAITFKKGVGRRK
jgi:hypothetical protein